MRPLTLLLLVLTAACNHNYFTGDLDRNRVSHGEVYLQEIELGDGRHMIQTIFEVDAPPSQVLNLLRDIGSYPTWAQGMTYGRVLTQRGDELEVELETRPVGLSHMDPLHAMVRLDPAKLEWSMTGFENDWVAGFQAVLKIVPIDGGTHSLLTYFQQGEFKLALARLFKSQQVKSTADIARRMQQVALLPQYASPPPPPPTEARLKVAIPVLTADGVPPALASTLTRVLAEALMRMGSWQVSTPQEVAAMLTYSAEQQLLGCNGSAACTLDIGKAMGADRLVVGSLGRVGEQYVLTASLMRMPDGVVEKRVTRTTAEGDLLRSVEAAAAELTQK